jgi:hypothetical protein
VERSVITYWSAVVRRVAPVAGLITLVAGGAMLAVLLVGDGPPVQVSIDITVAGGKAVAGITCRPTTAWKRLHGGASWAIGGLLERQVRATLNEN